MNILISALFLLSTLAIAAEPKLQLGDKKIEGVALAETGDFGIGETTSHLTRLGAGLRYKKIVFVKAKVYVAQLFGNEPAKYKKSEAEALASLGEQKAIAMQLTFLRNVDAKTIKGAFKEGLEENKLSPADTDLAAFLAAVEAGGECKEGTSILIVADRPAAGKERVAYTGPNGKATVLESSGGLIQKIFSLWLGKVGDSGLESLKKELTAP